MEEHHTGKYMRRGVDEVALHLSVMINYPQGTSTWVPVPLIKKSFINTGSMNV